ncbi:hypothetical protein KAI92_01305 [Candidatus Parcubacteria bacterium]|nr:hypothetical protein [Candidatus Parcubacteria bacterium]
MNVQQEKYKEIKEKAEKEYKKTKAVFSPFLKRNINFNSKGLDHIKFKEWNKTRLIADQYLRLKFLKLAPRILEKATTLQEFNETKNFERKRKNTRWEKILTPVKYYGFVALLNYKIKIKIIVKEVEGGQPFFWSIMPFWKTKNNPIIKQTKKVFHEGDLEND